MMMNKELKQSVLVDLVNFSSYQGPLNSLYFQTKYKNMSKRELTLIITELIETHDKHLICSKDDGYYVAKNIDEANHGVAFIASREVKLRERRQRMERVMKTLFGQTEPTLFNQSINS